MKTGIEVRINDAHGRDQVGSHDCGGVTGTIGPEKNMAKPAGQWNHVGIKAVGNRLKVHLNRQQVIDLQKTGRADKRSAGYVGACRTTDGPSSSKPCG